MIKLVMSILLSAVNDARSTFIQRNQWEFTKNKKGKNKKQWMINSIIKEQNGTRFEAIIEFRSAIKTI